MRLAIAALLLALPSAAEAKTSFAQHDLRVPGTIAWVADGDLDGDGNTDLAVTYRRGTGPAAKRFVAIFFRRGASYNKRPDLAFAAPRNAALFDVGDALGDGAEELIYLASDGVYAQSFPTRRAGRPTRIVEARSLIAGPQEAELVHWDFLRHPAEGVPLTLLVPTFGGIVMYRRDGAVWKVWSTVEVDLLSRYESEKSRFGNRRGGRTFSFRATNTLPSMAFVDQTGDGKIDLVTHYEDRVAVHPMRADGTITSTPTHRRWLRMRSDAELQARDTVVDVQVVDIDGDGIADISATKIGGGLLNMESHIALYRGVRGGGFEAAPSQKISEEGFSVVTTYRDLDGDGKMELIQPYSPVSILALTGVLLSSELSLEIRVRRLRDDRPMAFDDATQTMKTVLGFDFSTGASLRGAFPKYGDLDGDGRRDALLSMGTDRLGVFRGVVDRDDLFEDDPSSKIETTSTLRTTLFDSTTAPNARQDILMVYDDLPDLIGRMSVFTAASK